MKNLITCIFCLFSSASISAETIYTRTTLMAMVGDCFVYQTTFWADNNTTLTTADDRYLGDDYLLDCPENKHPELIPDFTDPFFNPKTAEDLSKWEYWPNGMLKIPSVIKCISYAEYLTRLEKEELAIEQLLLTEISNQIPIGSIKMIKMDIH